MKLEIILFSLICILLLGMSFSAMYSSTVGHEEAHVQINKYFGMESTYTVDVGVEGISGLTTPDSNDTFYSDEDRRAAYMVHGINEAIGYQLNPLFSCIMLFFVIIIILLVLILFGGIYNGENNDRRETTTR